MFGIFGILAYGLFMGREWSEGVDQERLDRINAKKNHNALYIDKWGHYRHTDTGKKYTVEDGKKAYHSYCASQEKTMKKWGETYDSIEIDYYVSYYNDFIKDKYNLTYEEWIIASQKVTDRLYLKYKNNFTEKERRRLMDFGIDNKLRK